VSEPTEEEVRTHSQKLAEKMIEERIRQARKEEVLAVYDDLLQTIWDRIQPTLGRVTVMAIVERSLTLTRESYPSLAPLQVTEQGLSFEALREQIGNEERITLRDGLKELVANLIDILAMLTGDILVKQLIKEIEGASQR
jgi:hypothetical protein